VNEPPSDVAARAPVSSLPSSLVTGVGFPYIADLPTEIYQSGLIDLVEVTPESLCRERRSGGRRTLELIPSHVERARQTCDGLPIVVHGVELSIGSADGWNDAYVDMLDRLWAMWPFLWHSEHLGFQTIPHPGASARDFLSVGVPLPLPSTREAVDLVAPRAAALRERYGVPFLLENPAHYLFDLPFDDEIAGETGLMNAIVEQGGCGQLLDLHNLYCNALNFGVDVADLLAGVRLERVVEIHVAGGCWRDGFYMDGHNAGVPDAVWRLLEDVVPRAPQLAGLVFEVLDEAAPQLGPKLICHELERAREIWRRLRRPEAVTIAAGGASAC
jgi:uncharacterized protein (UPF0276 family)